jgi:hypothetical protein
MFARFGHVQGYSASFGMFGEYRCVRVRES